MNNVNIETKISVLLRKSHIFKPIAVLPETITNKRELNIEVRLNKLRDTKSIPPDFFDVINYITDVDDKNKIITSLQKIYGHIASVKRGRSVLEKFKTAKINIQSGDESISSLSEIYNKAQYFSKVIKKFEKAQTSVIDLTAKQKLTNRELERLDKNGQAKDDFNEELQQLKTNFMATLKETESSIASMGIK